MDCMSKAVGRRYKKYSHISKSGELEENGWASVVPENA
jgi:hypothetical protein